MHKILRIVYGMLKNMQPFDPGVDKLNAERSNQKQQDKEQQKTANTQKTRRHQQYDSKAPVSSKQTKKRKEQALSQSARRAAAMGGMWKRSMVKLVRHPQTQGRVTDRLHLNHRATSRLYHRSAHLGTLSLRASVTAMGISSPCEKVF